jgi:hypothetical protein
MDLFSGAILAVSSNNKKSGKRVPYRCQVSQYFRVST